MTKRSSDFHRFDSEPIEIGKVWNVMLARNRPGMPAYTRLKVSRFDGKARGLTPTPRPSIGLPRMDGENLEHS